VTQLKRNNLHMGWKVAGRSFTAKCGHHIKKGEQYHVSDDYFGYRMYHMSQCRRCTNGKEAS